MNDPNDHAADTPTPQKLGAQLRRLRALTGDSLRRVADATGYSTAYLMKLERGEVRSPSPHLLRALARHYSVSYLSLMAFAGYQTSDNDSGHAPPAPDDQGSTFARNDTSTQGEAALIADALTSDRFTAQEREAIAAFISSLKSRDKGSM